MFLSLASVSNQRTHKRHPSPPASDVILCMNQVVLSSRPAASRKLAFLIFSEVLLLHSSHTARPPLNERSTTTHLPQ